MSSNSTLAPRVVSTIIWASSTDDLPDVIEDGRLGEHERRALLILHQAGVVLAFINVGPPAQDPACTMIARVNDLLIKRRFGMVAKRPC